MSLVGFRNPGLLGPSVTVRAYFVRSPYGLVEHRASCTRIRVLVFLVFVYWLSLSLRKRPWPLRRSRGDGNGRPLLPSFVRHSMCVRADLAALDR